MSKVIRIHVSLLARRDKKHLLFTILEVRMMFGPFKSDESAILGLLEELRQDTLNKELIAECQVFAAKRDHGEREITEMINDLLKHIGVAQ